MVLVQLKHDDLNGGTAVRVLCDGVSINGSKTTNKAPYINGGLVDVQTVTYAMPKITLQNIHFTGQANTLSIEDVMTLYTLQNNDDKLVLNVTYGNGTALELFGEVDINLVMETFSIPLSTATTKNAYMPVGNIVFTQTK